MRVLPCGAGALLVEVDSSEERAELVRRLSCSPLDGVHEVVPAARTVLLTLAPGADIATIIRRLADLPEPVAESDDSGELLTIPVIYDGPDLTEVASHLGISVEEVVRRHTRQTWTCDFVGFLPGFGYLTGDSADLDVPRRVSPRGRIPAGSVALAAGLSAIYPSPSPGGWQLIGRTDVRLFDVDRDPPGLVTASTRVRFVETPTPVEPTPTSVEPPSPPVDPTSMSVEPVETTLTIEHVQTQALVQDLGRPGYRHLGVPPSGAADRASLARGNRLLGNPPAAAGIEVLLGGLTVRAARPTVVAVTGAAAPVTVDSSPVPIGAPVGLSAGQVLSIGLATSGLRCYLTVHGGIAESDSIPRVLGSLSSDPTSALGPEPLAVGSEIAAGVPTDEPHLGVSIPPASHRRSELSIHATWGPRADWLTEAARADLASSTWTVSSQTDRVGLRLDGAPAELRRSDQLPSEGLVRGCVQVPPNGLPIVFLADHPTTGGYPVVAVVDEADTDLLAQAPPGTPVRLHVR